MVVSFLNNGTVIFEPELVFALARIDSSTRATLTAAAQMRLAEHLCQPLAAHGWHQASAVLLPHL